MRGEETCFDGDALVGRSKIDPIYDIVIRPRFRLHRPPASIEEDADGDATASRPERGLEERTRDAAPVVLEVESLDRDALPRGGEGTEHSVRIEGRVGGEDEAGFAGGRRHPA